MPEVSVQQFYAGKHVLVTGGSGFVGVCLIEKLLRSCPDVARIYLLLRPKRGKEVHERLEDVKKSSVFERLLGTQDADELFSKLRAVAGEIGEPNLGLSDSDRDLLCREVDIVFHSAATLDFDASFKSTVRINLLGTRRVTELCADMQHLNCLVHVSSAYVNSWRLQAEEVIYPLSEDPEKIIDLVNSTSDDDMAKLMPQLLGDHPNSYTFTKHMAEHEVQKCEDKFPCTIVRPSMITASWKEPMPGWTVSKNGPQGFLMGASKGVIRRLPVGTELVYDYIPVDTVVNSLIVAGYKVAVTEAKKVEVYHCTSSTRRPFKWAFVEDKVNGYLHQYPLKSAVWYPHLKFLPSVTWYRFSAFFVHILPAIILDMVTRVSGGRPILMKLHRNVNASLTLLEKFIFTEWMFFADHSEQLHVWLQPEDKKTFCISIANLDWRDYFISLTQGVRKYLSKENPKNLDVARNKDKILMVAHYTLMFSIFCVIWFTTAVVLGTTMSKTALVVPLTYFLLNFI